ncbi:MAG: glycyl-radical enzyme activating protein [Clostridia bacterium]|nr:glycyl-radical enzyme activating protein [Clostridia bacterium]
MAIVFDIQKFSVNDGPGIRTIVFLKGCPLHCQWCANPESNAFKPELMIYPHKCIGCGKCAETCESGCFEMQGGNHIYNRSDCINCGKCTEKCYAEARRMSGKEMTAKEIIEEVDKDELFYENSGGGITFSGGEPLCYPDLVAEVLSYYKNKGISTAIETCGYVPWEDFEKVSSHLNLVMFDIKILDDEKHRKYTGVSNKEIHVNFMKISQLVTTVVRIPIIPTINDSEQDIKAFGEFVSRVRNKVKKIHILPYHKLGLNKYQALGREYSLQNLKMPSDDHMEEIKEQLESYGFYVCIGG